MASLPSGTDMLFIIIMLLLPILASAQPRTNVTLGSSLVANSADSTWLSPSSEFAFGFQQTAPNGGYLLAIWFHQIPEKTIIWSANRDELAPEGSRVQLAANGRLQLNYPSGRQIWAAESSAAASYAAMLDTGNFALFSSASANLWQTFDQPTDTLLPTQILNQGGELISSFSDKNFSRGRFLFRLQTDGNLVWYTRNFPMNDIIKAYLATGTVGDGFRLIFNQTGYFNLVARNGTLLSNLFSNLGASSTQYYQRLTLEYDGVLRHYVYPKSDNRTDGRPRAWSVQDFLPSNICTQVRQDTGGGACGLNSLCSMGNDQRPRCSCPFDYSPIDPNDLWSGCKKDFLPHSCDAELQDSELFVFKDMPDADWPDSDYAHFSPVSEDWCRQQCLTDCFCDVAIYRNADCWKKRFPLSNGKIDSGVDGKALIKVRARNATVSDPLGSKSGKKNRLGVIIAGAVLLASSVFLNAVLFASKLFLVGKKSKKVEDEGSGVYPGLNIRCFSFKELQEATDGFRLELGNGAYSTVYKGVLLEENGKVIAVKMLTRMADDADQEFKAEVSSISRTNHKNLVQLLGYCAVGQNRLLVYEFMSNGSLADVLFVNKLKPNWHTRLQIAFSVARGICYLHEDCSTQIIHCDIKPQNVLLDDAHTAKISDFGLAKLLKSDQTRTTTGIRGTRGYVAPEWFRNMPITVKVDVYSYGVLLLELLCCRKNFEPEIEDERKRILSDWAYDCCSDGTVAEMVVELEDEEMRDEIMRFEKMVKIAMWCIQEDPELRPQMKRVVHMLEGSAQVPPPPDPSSQLL